MYSINLHVYDNYKYKMAVYGMTMYVRMMYL